MLLVTPSRLQYMSGDGYVVVVLQYVTHMCRGPCLDRQTSGGGGGAVRGGRRTRNLRRDSLVADAGVVRDPNPILLRLEPEKVQQTWCCDQRIKSIQRLWRYYRKSRVAS